MVEKWHKKGQKHSDLIQKRSHMSPNTVLNEEIIDDLRNILGKSYLSIFNEQIMQAHSYIADIKNLMQKNELYLLSRKAHALKSSCGQVGLHSIHLLAKELEYTSSSDAEKGEASPRIAAIYAQIVQEYPVAVECLYAYIGVKNGAPLAMAKL